MKQRVLILVAVLFVMTASSSALAGSYVGLTYVDPGSGIAIQIGGSGYGYAPIGYYGRHHGGYYPRYRYERRHYRPPVRYYHRPHHYRHHDRHYRGHYRHYDRGYRGYRQDRRYRYYDRRWR